MHTRKRVRRELEEHKKEDAAAAATPAVAAPTNISRSEAGAAAVAAAPTVHETTASPALSAAQQTLIDVIRAHPEEADHMLSVLQHHLAALFAAPIASASASAAAAQSAASTSHGSSPPRLPPQALLVLRDRALVTPILALVLSFLPPLERMQLGRVSRRWLTALQQPSLWSRSGWHCSDDQRKQLIKLPALVRSRMGILRCGLDWLLCIKLLSQLRELPQLRRLDLLPCKGKKKNVTAETLQQALQPLRLEVLTLPQLHPVHHEPLISALSTSTAARPSLLAAWAPTLIELQLYAKVDESDRLLQALAELPLPALRSLTVTLIDETRGPFQPHVTGLVRRILTPQRVPHLQTLHCRHQLADFMPADFPGTFLASVWLPILPRLSTLTSLSLSSAYFDPPLPALKLLRAIDAHNLPSLRTLDLQGVVGPSTTVAEQREVEQILQRMDCLTQLAVVTSFTGGSKDWLHSLRQLPSLLTLKVKHKTANYDDRPTPAQIDRCLHSISDLSRVQSLTFHAPEETPRLLMHWWRQCGKPTLASSRFKPSEWQKLQQDLDKYGYAASSFVIPAQPSPPAIRELFFPRYPALSAPCLAYLAHLPQLHTLHIAMRPGDVQHLSILQQLRSLVLWLHSGEEWHPYLLRWSNAALRSIGDTRLPQLHTLHLAGSNEDPVYDWCDPADPNFDWTMTHEDENIVDSDDHELEQPHRAELENISVEGGMRHLLQLPALTRLTLPYVLRDSVEYLHELALQSGRRALLIDSLQPFSRRTEFQGRWIDENSPPFPRAACADVNDE